jgi:hypothetical protein
MIEHLRKKNKVTEGPKKEREKRPFSGAFYGFAQFDKRS